MVTSCIYFISHIFLIMNRNVPLRQMSPSEMAEIERKATEIERGSRYEDIDEDDAGNFD